MYAVAAHLLLKIGVCRATIPLKGGEIMAYICPLMSTAEKQVPCTTNCALFLKDGKNATCSINISAIHTLEIRKAVELLGRDDRR